ncbi:MAG: hydrogenase small subunit [Magnetococcales bacterium]|nr:hydrogenase small subunit [Magnetococcales bacterium]
MGEHGREGDGLERWGALWEERTGLSRRGFAQLCAWLAATMTLTSGGVGRVAEALAAAPRPPVIWLHFQECTACSESLLRAHYPTAEQLILNLISLDYHETLMAAAGKQAEEARRATMKNAKGKYLLVVEGAIPARPFCRIGGQDAEAILKECAADAAAVIAVGSCASFGGLPAAEPNPTQARSVAGLIGKKPLVAIPGCPPQPAVMAAVLAHYLTLGRLPALDQLHRPKAFYADSIHDRCYRRPFYDRGQFAASFDDEGARKGWCLFKLGCKGPVTHNACATLKWNEGVSFPIQSGHGCLGCSEPHFWDNGSFYAPLSTPIGESGLSTGVAAAAGATLGAALAGGYRKVIDQARSEARPVTLDDLEKSS